MPLGQELPGSEGVLQREGPGELCGALGGRRASLGQMVHELAFLEQWWMYLRQTI